VPVHLVNAPHERRATLRSMEGPRAEYSRADAAVRAGVTPEYVNHLIQLGMVKPKAGVVVSKELKGVPEPIRLHAAHRAASPA
jgi:hypothetical protein